MRNLFKVMMVLNILSIYQIYGQNTFYGVNAGISNTTGWANTFIGHHSGYINTVGLENTFLGKWSGFNNKTGSSNTFIGSDSGYSNTAGYSNSFLGKYSGLSNTTGGENTFLGAFSGRYNVTGSQNTFVGGSSGYNNTTGASNTFLGNGSGANTTNGSQNTFLGYRAGANNETGWANTYIGHLAGLNNNGYGNVFLGRNAGDDKTNTSNTLIIQNGSVNDTPLIQGDFVSGNVAIGSVNVVSDYKLYINGNAFANGLWISSQTPPISFPPTRNTNKSQSIKNALDKINAINSVVNTTIVHSKNKGKITNKQYGIESGSLEKIFPDLVKKQRDNIAINYQGLIPVVIEAMKEINAQNKKLQKEIEELKTLISTQSTSNEGDQIALSSNSGFKLLQNTPNPFESKTTIRYKIPIGYSEGASIVVFDNMGVRVKTFTNLKSGDGEINIDSAFLPVGVYFYSLLVHGKVIATKKMVFRK